MTSLADHVGGQYLKEGDHSVQVESYSTFQYNSGSPGVEFTLRGHGGTTKLSFCLHEKSLFNLANFARDCGLNEDQMRAYDPYNPACHNVLRGRMIGVQVIAVQHGDKTYHEAIGWYPAENPPPATMPSSPPAQISMQEDACPF